MKVIDIDSHSLPRTEDYTIEPEYAHLRPRSYPDSKGNARRIFNNRLVSVISGGEQKRGYAGKKAAWRAANHDASVRHHQVTEAGIDFQFVSTGIIGEFNYVDPKVGAAFCRAHNNFIYETFMKAYPKEFTGLPQLPLQDIPEAVQELQRCIKELGMRTFLIPTNPVGKDLGDPHWWNFYDAARDLGVRGIIVHAGSLVAPTIGKERLLVLGAQGSTAGRILAHPFEYSANIINLIFGGTLDSFPELRFAFLEAGAEFAIVLKHRIEENLEQIGYLREMLAHPLEWYFDHFYFLVDDRMLANDGKLLRYAIDELGADQLFIGSDYPHTDGTLDTFAQVKALNWLPPESREKMLGKNAETLIGHPVD